MGQRWKSCMSMSKGKLLPFDIKHVMETRNQPDAPDLLIKFFGNTISAADAERASAERQNCRFHIIGGGLVIAESST